MIKLVFCGSNKFYDKIVDIKDRMIKLYGDYLDIVLPAYCDTPVEEMSDFKYEMLLTGHFKKIESADMVVIFDFDGYVGKSTCMEIAYAYAHKKPIIGLCPPEDKSINFIFNEFLYKDIMYIKEFDQDKLIDIVDNWFIRADD